MSEDNKNYPESITLLNMYQKKSKAGNTYFSGTVGRIRYSLIKLKIEGEEGEPVWALKISPYAKDGASTQYNKQSSYSAPQPPPRRDDDFGSEFMG